jgi:RNA polymerase sigma-70 factor, ECF subfamily
LDLEGEIGRLRGLGDSHAAATKVVEGYGPEVFGFLVSLLRDEHEAAEAFSQGCEDLWVGFDRFEGRSSFRTWFYVLARHAAARLRRSPGRRAALRASLSEAEHLAERIRSETLPHLRTENKRQLEALRATLSEEERALLVLRVDREMAWRDIACVLSPEGNSDESQLDREAARFRKRFQVLKDTIRERASQAGLLPE